MEPIIGAGATVLGVTLTSRRDDRIRREERESSRRAQLEQALWRYLAAIFNSRYRVASLSFIVIPR